MATKSGLESIPAVTLSASQAEGWCKSCQSVEHSSERCPLKAAMPVDTDNPPLR